MKQDESDAPKIFRNIEKKIFQVHDYGTFVVTIITACYSICKNVSKIF